MTKEDIFNNLQHYKVIPFTVLAVIFYFLSILVGILFFNSVMGSYFTSV